MGDVMREIERSSCWGAPSSAYLRFLDDCGGVCKGDLSGSIPGCDLAVGGAAAMAALLHLLAVVHGGGGGT